MQSSHSIAVTLYGIPNCDTVKKSRAWFADRGIEVAFHDFKKAGLDDAVLQEWLRTLGAQQLLNRRGTTWRKLMPQQQASAEHDAGVAALLLAQTSLIKRPVVRLEVDGKTHYTVGHVPEVWQTLLQD